MVDKTTVDPIRIVGYDEKVISNSENEAWNEDNIRNETDMIVLGQIKANKNS